MPMTQKRSTAQVLVSVFCQIEFRETLVYCRTIKISSYSSTATGPRHPKEIMPSLYIKRICTYVYQQLRNIWQKYIQYKYFSSAGTVSVCSYTSFSPSALHCTLQWRVSWVKFLSDFQFCLVALSSVYSNTACSTCMYRPKNIWEDDMSTFQVTTVFFCGMYRQITLATKCSPDDIQISSNIYIHISHIYIYIYTCAYTQRRARQAWIPRVSSFTSIPTLPNSYHIQTTPNQFVCLYFVAWLHDVTLRAMRWCLGTFWLPTNHSISSMYSTCGASTLCHSAQ